MNKPVADRVREKVIEAMEELDNSPFSDINVRIVKRRGRYEAIEVETKRRENLTQREKASE